MRTRIVVPVAAICAAAAVLGAAALASGAQVKGENRALFAVLTGNKEVGTDGRKGAGDPNGRGSFSATVDGGELCFGITVKNIETPMAAHIHRGGRNTAGDVVVPLTHPESGDPGASAGCVAVEAALARAILRSPRKYYANVHTGDFPGGAVRGQLFRKAR